MHRDLFAEPYFYARLAQTREKQIGRHIVEQPREKTLFAEQHRDLHSALPQPLCPFEPERPASQHDRA